MLPAMTLGAVGAVDGPPVVVPELWVDIWTACKAGDLAAAEMAQDRATETVAALSACGGSFRAIVKAVIDLQLGIDCGAGAGFADIRQTASNARADHRRIGVALIHFLLKKVQGPFFATQRQRRKGFGLRARRWAIA